MCAGNTDVRSLRSGTGFSGLPSGGHLGGVELAHVTRSTRAEAKSKNGPTRCS
jgi:hypothetical protein